MSVANATANSVQPCAATVKRFRALLATEPTQETADSQFSLVTKALDQAAAKKLIHKNTASRVKSRLAALKKKTFVG
ncbi:MAG UNVERIFIED_CONTAM: 30S ribosomal protein S20 [Planctomycetaceae bacterium]|jgi:small subunit ribosomal protein S20